MNRARSGKGVTGGRKVGLILSCIVAFAVSLGGFCHGAEKKDAKEQTVITSQSLTADNKAKTALFDGNVVVKRSDVTLYADRMLVYYGDESGGSSIKKIESEGNVKLVKGDRVITARASTYFAEPEERVVFTGDPRASEGENIVTGSKMTYFVKEDRSVVENSKVFLVTKGKTEGKGLQNTRPVTK
jgi:lipopolysaccharide export system protein LptA